MGQDLRNHMTRTVAGELNTSNKDIVMTFDTIGDLVRQASYTDENCWPETSRPSRQCDSAADASWTGSETFDKAAYLAVNGWDEGAAELYRRADASTRMRKNKPLPSLEYDVGGLRPDVPLYCAGDPAHMISEGMTNAIPKPMIKIVWNANISSEVSKEHLWNYGAAILACVLGLESKGFRTRLAVLTSVYANHPVSDYYHHWTKTTLKNPGDIVDVSKIAFAACNPGFMRRIALSTMEQCSDIGYARHMEYVSTCECVSRLLTQDEVYIPGIESIYNATDTFENALEEVQRIFKKRVKDLLPPDSKDWSKKASEDLFAAIT